LLRPTVVILIILTWLGSYFDLRTMKILRETLKEKEKEKKKKG
jgi:hypothetical protein